MQLRLNRLQVKNLFRLQFIPDNANVIFLGRDGLGKSNLPVAFGYQACLNGPGVLFATAIDVIKHTSTRFLPPRPPTV